MDPRSVARYAIQLMAEAAESTAANRKGKVVSQDADGVTVAYRGGQIKLPTVEDRQDPGTTIDILYNEGRLEAGGQSAYGP